MDARTQDLVHELRRQECGNMSVEGCYGRTKKRAKPHASDEVGVHVMEKTADVTRVARSKNAEGTWSKTVVAPVALFNQDQLGGALDWC